MREEYTRLTHPPCRNSRRLRTFPSNFLHFVTAFQLICGKEKCFARDPNLDTKSDMEWRQEKNSNNRNKRIATMQLCNF